MTTTATDRALRIREVCARVGMSRAWVYQEVAAGRFPRHIKLGYSSAWLESEVDEWLAGKAREARGGPSAPTAA